MKKNLLQILFIIVLFNTITFAQNNDKFKEIDDFGQLGLDELLSRMDNFRSQLNNEINSIGFIKISGGAHRSLAFPYSRGAVLKAYLVNDRKLEPNRLIVQNCDVSESEIRTQLFIVPLGIKIEKCNQNLEIPEKTTFFDSEVYENPYFQIDGCCDITEARTASNQASQKFLAELLNKSPESKIYLIVYLGTNVRQERVNKKGEWESIEIRTLDKPILAEKTLRKIGGELRQNGINASRIVKVNGGYKDETRSIEFWFVPKGGEVPKPKSDYFPKKKPQKKK